MAIHLTFIAWPAFVKALVALILTVGAHGHDKGDENSEKCQKTHDGYESQL